MELWILSAGAILLIGITLWLVWPARTADPVESTVRGEEVFNKPMTDSNRLSMPPQGDTFEDQYTSATADLSAGGSSINILMRFPETPSAASCCFSHAKRRSVRAALSVS